MSNTANILPSKRYKANYYGDSIYIIVVHDAETQMPLEMFVQFDQEGHNPAKYRTEAGWDAFTRMLSGRLQHPEIFPYIKTIRQVDKSSRTKNDLPGIVAGILKRYLTEAELKEYEKDKTS